MSDSKKWQVTFRCDGCGKESPGVNYGNGNFNKPNNWFIRGDDDGVQIACSRACIETVSNTSGKTSVVLPK